MHKWPLPTVLRYDGTLFEGLHGRFCPVVRETESHVVVVFEGIVGEFHMLPENLTAFLTE